MYRIHTSKNLVSFEVKVWRSVGPVNEGARISWGRGGVQILLRDGKELWGENAERRGGGGVNNLLFTLTLLLFLYFYFSLFCSCIS